MFRNEIDHKFTAKTAEYIAKGYRIHTSSMSGSQGEIAKIDITNEKEIIRILLYIEYNGLSGSEIVLATGKVNEDFKLNSDRVIWNSNLEILEEERWVRVTENYFVTAEDFTEIRNKRHERFERNHKTDKRVFGAEAKMIALQFIKKQPKCKSAKLTNIERVFKERYWNPLSGTHENRYLIIAKNKTFKMK